MSASKVEPHKDTDHSEFAALLLMPITFGMTMLESLSSVSDAWLQMLFSPAHQHGHDHHQDLEVPDPIEDAGEHDLFA